MLFVVNFETQENSCVKYLPVNQRLHSPSICNHGGRDPSLHVNLAHACVTTGYFDTSVQRLHACFIEGALVQLIRETFADQAQGGICHRRRPGPSLPWLSQSRNLLENAIESTRPLR